MNRHFKGIICLFLVIIFFPTFQEKVRAEESFAIIHKIIYSANPQGVTAVEEKITIENLTNDSVATVYAADLKQIAVYDVYASDIKGVITPEISRNKNNTSIKLKLKALVIGKGKKNIISLNYKTKSIAQKVGQVWNVNIPKVLNQDSSNNYNVTLIIPKTFGNKIFIAPLPQTTQENLYNLTYTFGEHGPLKDVGITASFGNYQTVNFKLKYQIKNDSIFSVNQEIALPPDVLNFQTVYYSDINPQPHKIYKDTDGNYMAVYKLKSKESLNIYATGHARIFSKQIDLNAGGSFNNIPDNLINMYTKPLKFWESDSQEINEIANDLKKTGQSVAVAAKYIYDYVVRNLNYDFDVINQENVKRKGAKEALTTKDAKNTACMEFTDSFIALARSLGIPAREIDGYAFPNADINTPLSVNLKGGDLLHAWPEFYDPNLGWVQVDPTWENTSGIDYFTKLDTNHFAFVIKGLDSQYPYPAGTYKYSPNEKQVEVDFSNEESLQFNDDVQIKKIWPWNIFELLKGNKKYKITNKTGGTVYDVKNTGKDLLPFQSVELYAAF